MKLIVGLGNFPKEYQYTRHNIGFLTLDKLKDELNLNNFEKSIKFKCDISTNFYNNQDIILLKPNTYMNASGESVVLIMKFYKINIENLIVIHDEIDLPFGKIQLSNSKNPAGHKGVLSINNHIGSGYQRIRIGVGRPENKNYDISNYVLGKFTQTEQEQLDEILLNSILTIKTLI